MPRPKMPSDVKDRDGCGDDIQNASWLMVITVLGLLFPDLSYDALVIFPDYDLSKMKDFINQQTEAYVEKGILDKEEADAIKRIYSSL